MRWSMTNGLSVTSSLDLDTTTYFLGADTFWRSPGKDPIPNPQPVAPSTAVRITRLRATASTVVAPPTPTNPLGWLPEVTAADITTMLTGTHPTFGQAVTFSSLQGADSVTTTTDADGGTVRQFAVGQFQTIITRCPAGKKIVFDAGVYEVNQPDWAAVGAGSGAVRVPKSCAGFIGRVPPCTDMKHGSWNNVRPTTQRTVIRVKANTSPLTNVPGGWFQVGYSGSVRADHANIHWEGTEQGLQTPDGGSIGQRGVTGAAPNRRIFTNVFYWTQADGNTMRDCFSTGWYGNNGAPPGETFGIEWYHSNNGKLSRVCTDGRRGPDNVIYGAVGLTFGNAVNCTVSECFFSRDAFSGLVFFQTANCKSYSCVLGEPTDHVSNHISVGRTKGDWLNHERTTGSEHYDMILNTFSVGGSQVAQVTHSGDNYVLPRNGVNYDTTNGSLKMQNCTFQPILFGGQPAIETWGPAYGAGVSTINPPNRPMILNAAGVPVKYRWHHAFTGEGDLWKYVNQPVPAPQRTGGIGASGNVGIAPEWTG